MAPIEDNSRSHTDRDISLLNQSTPRTPPKVGQIHPGDLPAYPTPQSTKKRTAWTSSDFEAPRPSDDSEKSPESKKRARDMELMYVDSGSDSENPVQTPSKKPRKAVGNGQKKKKSAEMSNGRKVGSWTKEQIRALWDGIFVPPTRIDWESVSSTVPQRDKLSCSNKWRYDLLPKVQAFIDSLGE